MPILRTDLEAYFNGPRTLQQGSVVHVSRDDNENMGAVLLQIADTTPPEVFWANRAAYRRAIGEQVTEFESGE